MKKPKGRNISTMSTAEMREAGVPYLVDPNDLRILGLDPEQYSRTMETADSALSVYMLDRVKDADLISRLSTMRDQPMSDERN